MSRSGSAVLGCLLLLAAVTMTTAHGAKPDYARMRRHAQRLSESCRRKGKTLDDACITDPETTGGPYVWEQAPIRKNMTEGWPGIPLIVNITVMNSTTCTELTATAVEIWHCTADGLYSHFVEASAGNGTDTDNTTFLRAIQYTDDTGVASFETIFPGWYLPRATHIHVRVHFNITETSEGYSGGTVGHTGQLFFNDSVVEELATVWPYENNTTPRTKLDDDQVVGEQGGKYGLTTLTEMYPGQGLAAGVVATVVVGVDTTESAGPSGGGGNPPNGTGGRPDMPDDMSGMPDMSGMSGQPAQEGDGSATGEPASTGRSAVGGTDDDDECATLVVAVVISVIGGFLLATAVFLLINYVRSPSRPSLRNLEPIPDGQLLGDVSQIRGEKMC